MMSLLAMAVLSWLAGGTVEIPCRITVEPGRLEVTFENVGTKVSEFLVARGMPPYELVRVRGDGTIELRAVFICPLEWEHDCFHAEGVRLDPGDTKTFAFDWALPETLEPLTGNTHDGLYETHIERPRTKP